MKKVVFLTIAMFCFVLTGFSQNENAEFKPTGKPFIKVFSNYHTTFADGNTTPAFEITRAYLGYNVKLNNEFSGNVTLDVGDPATGKLQMTAFLKNAYFKYQKSNLTVNFGLISTLMFKVEETVWGNRYLEKTFADKYKLGSSADLGVSVAYKFSDVFSADMSVINGEGYKSLQSDDALRTTLGLTVKPVKKLTLRSYYDFMGQDATQSSIAGFIGYTAETISVGASYNKQMNFGMTEGHDVSGISVFGSVKASDKVKVLARFDDLGSSTLAGESTAWNLSKDGQLIIAGIEFKPVKGLILTPNFQGWNPAKDGESFVTSLYLNCELKF